MSTFSFDALPTFLKDALREQGIQEPTDIQSKMIPEALEGQSLIARSQTGTGKTLAYLLPALTKIDVAKKGLQVIVLAPTQELAMQVVDVAKSLTEKEPIIIGSYIGGANIKRQVEKLKKQKPQLAIGTPGRLLELIEMKKLKLHEVQVVAVDEADRMMAEHSSWEATIQIAKRAGRETQFLFVSATIPKDFSEQVAAAAPFVVQVEAEGGLVHTENVDHLYIRADERDKIDVARRVIHAENIEKGIVFVNQLEKVAETAEKFSYKGIKALALSSDQSKHEREHALKSFHKGETHILIASDVAARGLDIDNVTHIIQLDAPANSDSYLHRAGRTGRMGKSGKVLTIVDRKSEYKVDKYRRDLKIELKETMLTRGNLIMK
ncbi:DEAD/DEAH box helicase [Halalkalibacter krulwichiae]|uniref:DEAD-box ATP-dependent RNA helicase CshB n=1 Tax=Halalkalibacter krulwichiae TaxID=199441 RepID=A0A1X9MEL4_9BACI|nr:DEAD/DEAH box helicase [Halalkalibacter krulwichiae]ARK31885.1 DEAD-box ATP-dependent RNA helicase CshB [Halalkalibacter krulwichiae]